MIDFKQKEYLFLTIYIFIFFSIFYFLISPIFYKIKTLSQSLGYQEAILLIQNAQIDKFNEFKKNYDFFKKVLDLIDERLVPNDTPIDFFNFLEMTAKKYNLTIEIYQYDIGKKEKANTIAIKLIGDFQNMMKFLKSIENSKYFLEVLNINLEKDQKENTFLGFLNIKVYTK